MTLLTEIIDIHRFRTNERLASYAGLVPGTHSSGDKQHGTGLHKRRNAELRHVLEKTPVLLCVNIKAGAKQCEGTFCLKKHPSCVSCVSWTCPLLSVKCVIYLTLLDAHGLLADYSLAFWPVKR